MPHLIVSLVTGITSNVLILTLVMGIEVLTLDATYGFCQRENFSTTWQPSLLCTTGMKIPKDIILAIPKTFNGKFDFSFAFSFLYGV